jgi:hypothetical protein
VLTSLREDSAYGLWLASHAQSWSVPGCFLVNATFPCLTAAGDVGGPPHYLQCRTTGRWSCGSCLWLSLLLGWLYRSGCFSCRAHQSFPNGRWAVSLDLRAGTSKVSQFHFLDHWSVSAYPSLRSILKCRLTTSLRLASYVRMAG